MEEAHECGVSPEDLQDEDRCVGDKDLLGNRGEAGPNEAHAGHWAGSLVVVAMCVISVLPTHEGGPSYRE